MDLDISNRNLRELPDIPDNVVRLNCSGNYIRRIDKLPAGLKVLNCENNSLDSLDNLPTGIEVLRAGFNYLQKIDLSGYPNLHSVSLSGNKFSSIPKLSASVRVLHMNFNNINIASGIDTPLLELELHNCNLTSIGKLPSSLAILKCDSNDLRSLPHLPDNLRVLSCSNNKLEFLPPLPQGIQTVICQDNKLSILPLLPEGLETLVCDYNRIAHLPELPESLTDLSFRNNPAYDDVRYQREYNPGEIDEPDIPLFVRKCKLHMSPDIVPWNISETAFDFINLEDVGISDFLREDDSNIILVVGNTKYACNREDMFVYFNTPGVRFVYDGQIYFKLPWNQVICYGGAYMFNVLDYKVFSIEHTGFTVKRGNDELPYYDIQPKKSSEFFDLSQA